ncbi:hypothetical protein PRZ48_007022 [Zasmidium cellare]|uniref:Peptidase S8/S53 domain-containing protein n=1 Tax=Zasmidium cellare TaxID=395010 RepID=A0ABR0EI87_ZASCE|nr:hypothetical protein PRZ48_007022 [Zasmidium cellare]
MNPSQATTIVIPPGIRPPGPPPPISIDPSASFQIEVTVRGCNAQGSSTTETTTGECTSASTAPNAACSAPTGTFVVYPDNDADDLSLNAIVNQLQTYVDNVSRIYTSNAEGLGVLFWRLNMTEAQADEMRGFMSVASVNLMLPCDRQCEDPTAAVLYDDDAIQQLQFVSWPLSRGHDIGAMNGRYYFDDSNGEGVPVYIVDTGVNRNHPVSLEFTKANSRIRFLHVGSDVGLKPGDPQPEDDSQTSSAGGVGYAQAHGTGMLSLIAGDTLGVAKSADIIAVRLPRRLAGGGGFRSDDFLEGLDQVRRDLGEESPATRAVVLLAIHYLPDAFIRKSLDGDWIQDPSTQRPFYDVQGWEANGTSGASAMIAGLAAYFLQLDKLGRLFNEDFSPVDSSPDGMKTFIVKSAWPRLTRYARFPGDPDGIFCAGIWNTYTFVEPCELDYGVVFIHAAADDTHHLH